MRATCHPVRTSSPIRRPTRTTPTRRARCIASIRCGSSSTATPAPRPGQRLGLPLGPVSVGRGHGRRRFERRGAAGRLQRRIHRRRFDLDGLLQRPAGRRALSQEARRHLFDERQLSSGRERRHRRQSHHARHRRRDLVQRRQGQPADAAEQPGQSAAPGTPVPGYHQRAERNRKSESAAGHQQLLHAGRLWRRLRIADRDRAQRQLRRRLVQQLLRPQLSPASRPW